MQKVIVDYKDGGLYFDGIFMLSLTDDQRSGLEYYGEISSGFSVEDIIRLKTAGFDAQEIVQLQLSKE